MPFQHTPQSYALFTRLRAEAFAFAELARERLDGANGREVQERATALQALLSRGAGAIDARQADWLGGSA